MDINTIGVATVAAIIVICYLIGMVVKATALDNKWIPIICGVCGGIAEYFDIDPTLIRLGWVLFCALGGSGVLAYIVAALVIPERPMTGAVQ